jgi:hypothetical protein
VSKGARGTMADGAPACECGEPGTDDLMTTCSLRGSLVVKDCIDRRCAHCGVEQDNIGHSAPCCTRYADGWSTCARHSAGHGSSRAGSRELTISPLILPRRYQIPTQCKMLIFRWKGFVILVLP